MQKHEKSILIVDDDVDLSETMAAILKREGYKPSTANTIQDAIVKLRNQKFHCVFLDLRLGDQTGEEVIDFIRNQKHHPNAKVAIVIVSGTLDKGLLLDIKNDIQGALVKPFEQSSLTEMANKILPEEVRES